MSAPIQNKPLVVCAAIVASAGLVGLVAVLNASFPSASLVGFIVRTAPLAVAIPFVLIGFNAWCDRFEGQRDTNRIVQSKSAGRALGSGRRTAVDADRSGAMLKQSHRQKVNGDGSTPIIVPVSVHERFVRSVAPEKKWWVGQ